MATSQAASELLHNAKTDEALAEEVLNGGLNPDKRYPDRRPVDQLDDDEDDSDEVFVQIRMLLSSALSSGQLRKLARAVVLSWQAGYDSKLLRQAEPKMVKKAKEVGLSSSLKAAMEARNRVKLHECMSLANDLGLTQSNFPELAQAYQLDQELEAEVEEEQDKARPGHTKLMSSVIKEFSVNAFGLDIEKLEADVEKESVSAKEHISANNTRLGECQAKLDEWRGAVASSEKLKALTELHDAFKEINPRNLEDNLETLTEELGNLRADKAGLLLAMRGSGVKVVTMQASSGHERIHEEELEQLRARVSELEENEEVLTERIQASAKLGAKWMEEKKDKEIEELRAAHAVELESVQAECLAGVEERFKKQGQEAVRAEKMSKLTALKGLEESLTKQHAAQMQSAEAAHEGVVQRLQAALEAADRRISQMEKALRVMGVSQ